MDLQYEFHYLTTDGGIARRAQQAQYGGIEVELVHVDLVPVVRRRGAGTGVRLVSAPPESPAVQE